MLPNPLSSHVRPLAGLTLRHCVVLACCFLLLILVFSSSSAAPHRIQELRKVTLDRFGIKPQYAVPDESSYVYSEQALEKCGPTGEDGKLNTTCLIELHNRRLQDTVYSSTSSNKRYMTIDFGSDHRGINPSIVPHPHKPDTWTVVAQRHRDDGDFLWGFLLEIVCDAHFVGDTLKCIRSPLALPIASTQSPRCSESYVYANVMIGPHDARVALGPTGPYAIYGTPAPHSCLGQYIHDFRRLVDWSNNTSLIAAVDTTTPFFWPTELQRPAPYGEIEKNYFLFWDAAGQAYVHPTTGPKRVFAKLNKDGSTGRDLAPAAAKAGDAKCMAALMPRPLSSRDEHIHQATNSLLVTTCERKSEPNCVATAENTFVMIIFQIKIAYSPPGFYEPYAMLFRQSAPFEIFGISRYPILYHGVREREDSSATREMIFTTSMNWKEPGLGYHGFLDDTLLIGFGINDASSGLIDVTAKDLLKHIDQCQLLP